jgi:enamine deaminase RidA (YjgF/YER057c/UK114 family)
MDRVEREVVVPPFWADFFESSHIPAAVRIGKTVRLTGHTGDEDGIFSPDAEDQIRGTFRNIALTLAAAGATWADVVEINSFHVGYREQSEIVLRVASEFLSAPFPAWTGVGVSELYDPEAVVEISCVAVMR